ncbi:hypothetical protein [Microbaculum marinum]|uniref:hypothetical protein n=1 Tax=Microbaculum marinum TaxID=1764581 RepID=UPI0030EC4168
MFRRLFRGTRRTNCIAVTIVGVLLAGCQTDGATSSATVPDGTSPPAAQATPATDIALAFEPVVGIPEDRATILATELGAGAAQMHLPITGRDKPDVRFRIKGYFSAVTEGRSTRVSYIWDIFDTTGARVHRIAGAETVPAALPDPWSGIPDETLETIARATAEGLRQWIDQGAPTTAVAGDPMPAGATASLEPVSTAGTRAGLTETRTIATGGANRIPDAATATLRQSSQSQTTAAQLPVPPRFTYFLTEVSGATGDGAKALAHSLSEQLEAAGGARVATRDDAEYLISGEATIAPPVSGNQVVAIIWSVADTEGNALGSVRQIAQFAQGSLDDAWGSSAETAAASAASGVLALMPQ